MKKYIYNTFVLAMVVLMASCNSMVNLTVSGTPSTKIYTPEKEFVGTIDNSGKAKVRFESGTAFLLSTAPGYENYIPFGLDYKNHHKGDALKVGEYFAYTIFIAGLTAVATGLIAGEDGITAIGVGAMLAGSAAWGGCAVPGMKHHFGYGYKYLNGIRSNEDLFVARRNFGTGMKMTGKQK